MDNKIARVKKRKSGIEDSISFERDFGSRMSINSDQTLYDDGAYVSLVKPSSDFGDRFLYIAFGYTSSNRDYSRDISLNFQETTELVEKLKEIVDAQDVDNVFCYVFIYDDLIKEDKMKNMCGSTQKIATHKMLGYEMKFYAANDSEHERATIVQVDDKSKEIEGVIYKISYRDKFKLDKYYANFDIFKDLDKIGRPNKSRVEYGYILSYYMVTNLQNFGKKTSPRRSYLTNIIEGAEESQLSKRYVAGLRRRKFQADL